MEQKRVLFLSSARLNAATSLRVDGLPRKIAAIPKTGSIAPRFLRTKILAPIRQLALIRQIAPVPTSSWAMASRAAPTSSGANRPNFPRRKSFIAVSISALVFMTKGP